MESSAIISPCRRYRYELRRTWDSSLPKLMVVGLNPSTADAEQDDPTIRRCVGFAKRWGMGGLLMGNLYALRSTDPKLVRSSKTPIGPETDRYLVAMRREAALVLAAWGGSAGRPRQHLQRCGEIACLLEPLHCLVVNSDGSPKHPLYVRKDTDPIAWPSP